VGEKTKNEKKTRKWGGRETTKAVAQPTAREETAISSGVPAVIGYGQFII
jgi:hypothetical protein